MQVNKVNYQNTKNNQSFKGVNIFRNEYGGMMSLGVWITKAEEDAAVEFINGRNSSYDLGTSLAAEKLTNMLKELGKNITESTNMKKVRKLLNQVVNTDIIQELEKERKIDFYEPPKIYTIKNEIIGQKSLEDIKTVIKKGKPEYHPRGSKSKNSFKVLSLEMDPNEKVNVKISRADLAKLGIKQP